MSEKLTETQPKPSSCRKIALKPALAMALFPLITVSACALSFVISELRNPPPPGYASFLTGSDWRSYDIAAFLDAELPPDAEFLIISGRKGNLGSLGMLPTLEFSFRASPAGMLAFARQFCDGVFYLGYNPLIAQNSTSADPNHVLIRGAGTIHYSHSPGVPLTVIGNRCERPGEFWFEEFTVDMSEPDSYIFSYRLLYEAQVTIRDYFPQAERLEPLGSFPTQVHFPLYVTGLDADDHSLYYPTICFETVQPTSYLSAYVDAQRTWWNSYNNAQIAFFLDDLPQPSAQIRDGLLKNIGESPTERQHDWGRWEYCISRNWSIGEHTIRLEVQPPALLPETFEWSFEVLEPLEPLKPFQWP